jgi:hypothetical protein
MAAYDTSASIELVKDERRGDTVVAVRVIVFEEDENGYRSVRDIAEYMPSETTQRWTARQLGNFFARIVGEDCKTVQLPPDVEVHPRVWSVGGRIRAACNHLHARIPHPL